MKVLALVGLDAHGTVVHAHLAQHSAVQERPHVLINCRQRDGWDLFSHCVVNQLRAGMTVHRHHRLVNHPPLMRGREVVLAAERAEFSSSYHSIEVIIRYLLRLLQGRPGLHVAGVK